MKLGLWSLVAVLLFASGGRLALSSALDVAPYRDLQPLPPPPPPPPPPIPLPVPVPAPVPVPVPASAPVAVSQ